MKTTQRVLVTFLVAILCTLFSGKTVFASEVNSGVTVATQGTATEEESNSNNTDPTENALNNTNTNEQADTDGEEKEALDNEKQSQPLESYIDDDGQLYVLDSIDEQGEAHYVKADPADVQEPEDTEEPEKKVDEVASEEVKAKTEEAKPSYSKKDLRLLASLVYAEAGNQSYEGMLAVANVVLNRVNSDAYWHVNTIKEAIYDKKWSVQFAVTVKNKKTGVSMLDKALKYYDTRKFTGGNPEAEEKAMNQAIKAAKAALEGKNNIGKYLCFQNKKSASRIKKKYKDYKIIGDHIFYRTK